MEDTPYLAPPSGTNPGIPPRPNNWLVPAILITLFCCNYLGVVGVIYAARVDTKYNLGDYAGAENDAKQAKLWTLIPLGVGLLCWVGFMIFYGAIFWAAMQNKGASPTF